MTLTPEDTARPCCRATMVAIGADSAVRLDVTPARFRVPVPHRPKLPRRTLPRRTCAGVVAQTPAPPRPIAGGLPAGLHRSGQGQGSAGRDEGASPHRHPLAGPGHHAWQGCRSLPGVREAESRTLVSDQRTWFEVRLARLPACGPAAGAVRYALRHWDGPGSSLQAARVANDGP
ncbi:MAG: hypothetical protein ACRYHQ_31525 [Janthinobacterium lividum]